MEGRRAGLYFLNDFLSRLRCFAMAEYFIYCGKGNSLNCIGDSKFIDPK